MFLESKGLALVGLSLHLPSSGLPGSFRVVAPQDRRRCCVWGGKCGRPWKTMTWFILTWPSDAADIHSSTPLPSEEMNIYLKGIAAYWPPLCSCDPSGMLHHFLLSWPTPRLFLVDRHCFVEIHRKILCRVSSGRLGIMVFLQPHYHSSKSLKIEEANTTSDNLSNVSDVTLIHLCT